MNDDSLNSKKLEKLNNVSQSFCLAKWMQVTLDIVHGTTHSCHHPQRHTVPLDELKNNPSALHNTAFKKEQRKKMLSGVRPNECSYCWDMEDLGVKYSDRFIKSTDSWAWNKFDKIANLPWDHNINPSYLEVMIDNKCNFSCAYCMADISSSIANEIKIHGLYPVSNPNHRGHQFSYNQENHKIYTDAFKIWFKEIKNELQVLRLTGGEPFLSSELDFIISELKLSTNNKLILAINSHLSHKPEFLKIYIEKIISLLDNKNIGELEFYISLDTFGNKAEYIRHGLNYDLVISNLYLLKKLIPNCRIVIMCTFNILTIFDFQKFLEQIVKIKQTINLVLDISCLKNPEYLRADMATPEMIIEVEKCYQYMLTDQHFSTHEKEKLNNVLLWMKNNSNNEKQNSRRVDFIKFITEYDFRKNKIFLNIFPEYLNFYNLCKKYLLLQDGFFSKNQAKSGSLTNE